MQLQYDPQIACQTLRAADPTLGVLIGRIGAFAIEDRMPADQFAALLRSIVFQQLSGKAAGTIHARVAALFDNANPTPRALLALADTDLRAAGLSNNKTRYVKDLAARALEGVVPARQVLEQLDDAAIIKQLTTVRGIGRWTVEMLLIFSLGRPDVLPVDDLGVRKGYAMTWGLDALPKPQALADYGQRWAPYRTVAAWYLWRAADMVTPAQ